MKEKKRGNIITFSHACSCNLSTLPICKWHGRLQLVQDRKITCKCNRWETAAQHGTWRETTPRSAGFRTYTLRIVTDSENNAWRPLPSPLICICKVTAVVVSMAKPWVQILATATGIFNNSIKM
jgi:hypothetical protein